MTLDNQEEASPHAEATYTGIDCRVAALQDIHDSGLPARRTSCISASGGPTELPLWATPRHRRRIEAIVLLMIYYSRLALLQTTLST